MMLLALPDMCCKITVKILSDISEVTYFKQDPVVSWRRMGQRGKKKKEENKEVSSFIQMTAKLGT